MRQLIAVIVAACLLLSSCSAQKIRPNVHAPTIVAAPTFEIKQAPIELYKAPIVNLADLNCMVKGIYYEARGESTKGKQAVGFVILNRTKYSKYPPSICDVVKDNKIWHGKRVCQFSWYCDHGEQKLRADLTGKPGYEACLNIAKAILNGRIDNWMPQAVSFHVSSLSLGWVEGGMIRVTRIGNHTFFKERNLAYR